MTAPHPASDSLAFIGGGNMARSLIGGLARRGVDTRTIRVAEPVLVEPGVEGLLAAADEAALVVAGLPERWQSIGLGQVRKALALESRTPVLLVRRGLRLL